MASPIRYPAASDDWESPGALPYEIARKPRRSGTLSSQHTFEPAGDAPPFSTSSSDVSSRPSWHGRAVAALSRLAGYRGNWDSYGALPIAPAAVEQILELLEVMAFPGIPEPAVVPTPQGGIQLEWHLGQIDLEIETLPGERDLLVALDDRLVGEEWEEVLLAGSLRFANVLRQIVARS